VALRFIRSRPELAQARTADDIERIHHGGQIACLLGVEGGHMIDDSPAALRTFYDLGARYMTLTHWANVDWADAATDEPEHQGLTEFGKRVVKEMNRLGMFADLSHVSPDTMSDALRVSRAPVIFSHSSAFAINPHPRNVPDDVLRMMPKNGGVVHVNFIGAFVSPKNADFDTKRKAAVRDLHMRVDTDKAVADGMAEWDKGEPGSARNDLGRGRPHRSHPKSCGGSTISVSALIFMRRREVRWWPDWRTSRGIPICSRSCYIGDTQTKM
jgi:membrane dipeptidase